MSRKNLSHFSLWRFLNQPLFDPCHPLTLNPRKFARLNKLEYLSKCWSLDIEFDNTPNQVDEL